jgi:hypothetical protein
MVDHMPETVEESEIFVIDGRRTATGPASKRKGSAMLRLSKPSFFQYVDTDAAIL